jgi:oligopeptide/dipeptide ABC transporter ATP-binding protein
MAEAGAARVSSARSAEDAPELLAAVGVSCRYPIRSSAPFAPRRALIAVDHVSLALRPRGIVALVGESGSGKSTLGRLLLGLTAPSGGEVLYRGENIANLTGEPRQDYRREVQVVFQDSGTSFNPRRSIGEAVMTPLRYNRGLDAGRARGQADEMLDRVGLAPAIFRHRFPHELSGGQRQRAGLARALASNPRVIIADEPVSALDVSMRAQILTLLRDLKQSDGLACLLITHDLGVVRAVADRIVVMYLGAIMEEGLARQVMAAPAHPYTRALLAATPVADPDRRQARPARFIIGEPSSAASPPSGCRFQSRCPHAVPLCAEREPEFRAVGNGGRAACHFDLSA